MRQGWRVVGDPTWHQGGCKVSDGEGALERSVANRWQGLCGMGGPGVL
ncbi:FliH/SctL family protein [Salmonella enterica]